MPRRLRLAVGTLVASMATVSLAGCTQAVIIEPAPAASDPVCAEVLRATPHELGGAELRSTTAQSARAWGEPAITLRCGVAELGPTTDRCIGVTGADGLTVNWVVAENDEDSSEADRGRFTFTTYGRSPAIQVVVPVEYAGTDATGVLVDLAPAVSFTQEQRTCLGLAPDGSVTT